MVVPLARLLSDYASDDRALPHHQLGEGGVARMAESASRFLGTARWRVVHHAYAFQLPPRVVLRGRNCSRGPFRIARDSRMALVLRRTAGRWKGPLRDKLAPVVLGFHCLSEPRGGSTLLPRISMELSGNRRAIWCPEHCSPGSVDVRFPFVRNSSESKAAMTH